MNTHIHGFVAPGFEPVREAFAQNFDLTDEIGAGFALFQDGEVRVNVYGGYADRKRTRAWQADTIVPVFSTGKAIVSVVVAWLVSEGRLDYDAPISEVWPEFAQGGKGDVTLAEVLSHQAGLPGWSREMDPVDWFDRALMESRFAAMEPLWPLGQGTGYHPISFGVLLDAVVRRADVQARSVGQILKAVLAGPRGIDFQIGVPESDHARAAEHMLPPRAPKLGVLNPETEVAFLKPWSTPGRRGTTAWRSAELPAANGHGTAESLARLMAPFATGGRLDGEALIAPHVIAQALRPRIDGRDRVLPFDLQYAAGVMINRDSGHYGPEPQAVGHYGFGGSCAFADPVRGLSGGYVMNRQMDVLVGDERPMRLIETAYSCL